MHAWALVAIRMAEAMTDFILMIWSGCSKRLFGVVVLMLLMSTVVEGWIVMELVDVSSVSIVERPDPLYIICLNDHALYTAVLWWISH